jgi:hypothetical protein
VIAVVGGGVPPSPSPSPPQADIGMPSRRRHVRGFTFRTEYVAISHRYLGRVWILIIEYFKPDVL